MQLFLFLLPLQHTVRPALQNKRVRVLRMALRARKVSGSFEKRPPGRKQKTLLLDEMVFEMCFTISDHLFLSAYVFRSLTYPDVNLIYGPTGSDLEGCVGR